MDPKKAVKDLVLEAFQDEQVQEMFGNLMSHCNMRDGTTCDNVRDLLLDLVVESYMLSNSRRDVALGTGVAGENWHDFGEAASNTDTYMLTGGYSKLKELHNTNISNNKQQTLTSPSLQPANEEVPKENTDIIDEHNANNRREATPNQSHIQNTSGEGGMYRRVLSALRLAKKEHTTTDDDRCSVSSNTSEHSPCGYPETMSNHDDKLRRIWMRLSDHPFEGNSTQREANKEIETARVEIKDQASSVDRRDEEPSLHFKTLFELQEGMSNQSLIGESDGESNLDEYESASDNDADLESWHSGEHVSLSRASSASFLTASDHLDELVADLNEDAVLVKTVRPQFIGKYYLQRLTNARQTAAEISARKPEPRVKLDKPCRLDTNLTYAVRQSLRRSLPLVAGKNKLSALMMMADGMYDEMSLDRDLDDLAWPFDPLAELKESGLAMVDYMDPHPASSATLYTCDKEGQTLPSVTPSTTAQDVFDPNCINRANDKDDNNVETHELAKPLNSSPLETSGQPTSHEGSDIPAVRPSVSFSPKQAAVSPVSQESFQDAKSLRFLFKPPKSVLGSFLEANPFRVLVNQIQRSPADNVPKLQLLPPNYTNATNSSFVLVPDQSHKLVPSTLDESSCNASNVISDARTNEASVHGDNCFNDDDLYGSKELSRKLKMVKEIRPQFLGRFYLKSLANARQTAAETKARKPELRVKIDNPCRLDTNLMYTVHQSLRGSLPLIAGKHKLSALMMMADGMYDEMPLDRNLDDLAWPFDPLAELRESGLAMVDYANPCSADDDATKTACTFETGNEITSVEISSPDMDKDILQENGESEEVDASHSDSCFLPLPSAVKTESSEVTCDHEMLTNDFQQTHFDYSAVVTPPRTDIVSGDQVVYDHQDYLDFVSVDQQSPCEQIPVSSRDSIINTDDVTTGLVPLETCAPMQKEDDHQSVDSALEEEDSAHSFDKDNYYGESKIVSLTLKDLKVVQHEQGLDNLFEPLSSPPVADDENLSPTKATTVSSNIRLFEQLAIDDTASPAKSTKSGSKKLLNKATISEDIRKRAQVFENIDLCRPHFSAKQIKLSTEDEDFHTVNIKTQVAMFEKLFDANTSSLVGNLPK